MAEAVPGIRQVEVQEPRPRDVGVLEAVAELGAQSLAEALGDRPRLVAHDRRQQHRGVGREIAELRFLRPLERRVDLRAAQRRRGPPQRGAQVLDRIRLAHPLHPTQDAQ